MRPDPNGLSLETQFFPALNYSLAETLACGQAFRWKFQNGGWEGVIGKHWLRLLQRNDGIEAITAGPIKSWDWLIDYLQLQVSIDSIISTFPSDEHLQAAVASSPGLRLLKQDPWECLASFILSSTKQIVQIQQIVGMLCDRFGEPLSAPLESGSVHSFPAAERVASLSENDLRCCKMGFRAPYLHGSARMITEGMVNLEALYQMSLEQARVELLKLPGVGRKIADCVLLFAYGFQQAFPIDVWVLKAIKQLYFAKKRPNKKRIEKFTLTYFGPNAGYAQQYLFHYMRTHLGKKLKQQ
ncbi:MAG: DNA-3-methyladenine glycosylase family protein [Verrucomicrobiales bacterium]